MDDDRLQVQTEEAKEFCKVHKLFFIETSALADTNVMSAFETILKEIYRLISRKNVVSDGSATAFSGKGQTIAITDDNAGNPGADTSSKCC